MAPLALCQGLEKALSRILLPSSGKSSSEKRVAVSSVHYSTVPSDLEGANGQPWTLGHCLR